MAFVEEAADGGVGFEAQGDLVGVAGFDDGIVAGEEISAGGPIGLVRGEAWVGGQWRDGFESSGGAIQLRDCECPVKDDHG